MSESYQTNRYQSKNVTAVGTSPKKIYLVFFALILLAGSAGIAYVVHTSGILLENNPAILPELASRINLERATHDLPPVEVDPGLSDLAQKKSQEVKLSTLNYGQGVTTDPDGTTNILIVPKVSWALSATDLRQVSGSVGISDPAFLENVRDQKFHRVGIGVSGDSYNYYIVTHWKE